MCKLFSGRVINTIITGLVAVVLGLVGFAVDKPLTARQIKNKSWGLTEAQFKIAKWTLLLCGILLVAVGLVNEE
jgi:hypothetical protein